MSINPIDKLIFKTNLVDYLNDIKDLTDVLTIMAFHNIDEVAPILSNKEHEDLLDHLIDSRSLPYISTFNIRRIHVDIPTDINYMLLSKIVVDEMNLTQILIMIGQRRFPNLKYLEIYTGGNIVFKNLPQLETLCIYNMTDDILNLPLISDTSHIECLKLSGYKVEFTGRLPKRLVLEQCYVKNSSKLPGCEEMILHSSRWDTPSFPSISLHVEYMTYEHQPPPTLSSIELVHCLARFNLDRFVSLRYLKMLYLHPDSDIRSRTNLNIDTIIASDIDILTQEIDISSVKKIAISSLKNNMLPINELNLARRTPLAKEVIFYKCFMELNKVIEFLPKSVVKLSITDCVLGSEIAVIPNNVENLQFFYCTSNSPYITIPRNLPSLISIGHQPIISIANNPPLKYNVSKTEVLLMSLNEFRLYCISHMRKDNKNIFNEYNDVFNDIMGSMSWCEFEISKQMLDIFNKYPYNINILPSPRGIKNIILQGDLNTRLIIDRHLYIVNDIYEMYNAYKKAVNMGKPYISNDLDRNILIEFSNIYAHEKIRNAQ